MIWTVFLHLVRGKGRHCAMLTLLIGIMPTKVFILINKIMKGHMFCSITILRHQTVCTTTNQEDQQEATIGLDHADKAFEARPFLLSLSLHNLDTFGPKH